MKKLITSFSLGAMLAFAIGCGGNQTSDSTSDSTMVTSKSTDTSIDASSTASGTIGSDKDTSMADDRDFLMEAASGGLMEVTLGKIAQTNGSSAQVKEFGQMMITDHSKANAELKLVAAKKNVTLSSSPAEKQQKMIDELKAKKGADFDKAYVEMMADDHKEDISKFQDEADKGHDSGVKAFAAKTLPVLNKHLGRIQKIQEGMKK